MLTTEFTAFAARPLRPAPDRIARSFDQEIYPLVGQRIGAMVLRAAGLRPRSTMLVLDGGAGAFTAELLTRVDDASRIVALERSTAFAEQARGRLTHALGGQLVLRTQLPGAPLPFADETFASILAPMSTGEGLDAARLADVARLLAPGGELVLGCPLRGTWAEPLDLMREVLERKQRDEALRALDTHVETQPEAKALLEELKRGGLARVDVELARWNLVFRSAREFFYAPVIEHGPLPSWKEIAGRGPALQSTFRDLKIAIDTYYGRRPFGVTIVAGRFRAYKA